MVLNECDKTDDLLIREVLDGSGEAFEHLYIRYRGEVLNFCLTLTRNNLPDAKDILQESFVKAFVNLVKYNPHYQFGQWINAIARNTFIDHTRKKKARITCEQSETEAVQMPSSYPTPEQSMVTSQNNILFDRVINTLSKIYQEVIILRYLKEYSYEEISKELDIPVGTVKTRIRRARNILEGLLKDNGF